MNNHKAVILLSIIYLIFVSIFLVWHRMWFSPDQFFAVALIGTLVLGRAKKFIRDWSFPTVLFLSYEYLRGLAPKLEVSAHMEPMVYFDQMLFGSLPTITLQNIFFADGVVRWYDYLLSILYFSHFIVPMIVGFVFWIIKREAFRDYYLALLVLSYMAFVTFILFPAMPPWLASQNGYIPPLEGIMKKVFQSFPQPIDLPTVYRFVGANLVAAVPSLHAAYPFLTLLFVIRKTKYWGLLLLPYVFAVWFAIVYFGEHYVFDIVIGVIYAIFAFIFVTQFEQIKKRLEVKFR